MIRIAVFSVVALALAGSALAQRAEVIDGIAAIVNNDVVTISQVRDLIGARERSLREVYRGQELEDKIKEIERRRSRSIDRQLIQEFKKLQEEAAFGNVIDDRIQAVIREEFGGDRAAFVRTLQAQGYTVTKFKEIEREKIIIQAMRQSKVDSNFVISPTQIQAYYDKNRAAYSTPEQVKLRMIVIREGSSGDAGYGSKELAEEIRRGRGRDRPYGTDVFGG
jgi:parvulin-like peptidyl-prolyl isomerase